MSTVDVVYQYDGSFEGLLCCVYASYEYKEIPIDIIGPAVQEIMLYRSRLITTDEERASRVFRSISTKVGQEALEFVEHAFLTCLPQKELYILLFLRLGYRHGPKVMSMLTNEVVNMLFKAVTFLKRESHLFTGFIRFTATNQALVAEIEPKNYVLPLISRHFCDRYREEHFLIYDKTHASALVYKPYRQMIIPVESLELPEPDEEEASFRGLWRSFYNAIAIEGRFNPRCRMSHMPKRYWKYMTEFGSKGESAQEDEKLPVRAARLLGE